MKKDLTSSFLPIYRKIIQKEKKPAFLKAKNTPVSYDEKSSLDTLWNIHHTAIKKNFILKDKPVKSLLDLKIEIAQRLFSDCTFCEHRCHVDRTKKSGFCKVTTPIISSECVHYGEEKIFIPSHTIFFSGCNFHCVFCQNYNISQQTQGLYISPTQLAQRIEHTFDHNSINVNWVGGDPTPNVLYILKTMKHINRPIPQIWNSNLYCSKETMHLLDGIIDVFLSDFKFGNNACAESLAGISNYFNIITRNHRLAARFGEVFIRHLVLPNHLNCCSKPILSWISENIPETPVNIMDQYYPSYKAHSFSKLNRRCSKNEIKEITLFAEDLYLRLVK